MADITPVTREEMYLAKAGGQDVPTPTPVPREEQYLAKLSGQDVNVPTPITRREKFLYAASGGDIELPSEDKMRRIEKFMAKAGGMDVSTPTAVTRLEKFWANVEAGGWKTITGVLPLTFTAKGGTAVDWVISGNDENGTENLWNNELIQGTVNSTTGELVIGTTTRIRSYTYSPAMLAAGTYTINANGVDKVMVFVYDSGYNYNRESSTHTWTALPYTFTINESYYYVVAFKFDNDSDITPDDISQIMLVKGSTAPDHYIPYQQGVGERTGNLFDKDARDTENGYVEASYLRLDNNVFSNNSFIVSEYIPVEPNSDYYLSKVVTYGTSTGLCFYDENKTYISGVSLYAGGKLTTNITTPNNCRYIRTSIQVSQSVWKESMITQGSTPPETYIPYGYQIPITVSQQGETDKNYDIYIGDSPLTEGETVSKTSTGQDIELFEGENVVSTTLYNKPTMEIKYK